MKEHWRPVGGFEKFYCISTHGNVWSTRRKIILRPGTNTGGYRYVILRVNGHYTMKIIGQLVLKEFAGPRPKDYVMCHGPNGQQDDSLKNLSWGTRSKNNGADKRRDGTSNRGEKHYRAKVTWNDIRTMRRRATNGEPFEAIAKDFPISLGAVSSILQGKTWKDPKYKAINGRPGNYKVTWADVQAIRKRRANGETLEAIAKDLPITYS